MLIRLLALVLLLGLVLAGCANAEQRASRGVLDLVRVRVPADEERRLRAARAGTGGPRRLPRDLPAGVASGQRGIVRLLSACGY